MSDSKLSQVTKLSDRNNKMFMPDAAVIWKALAKVQKERKQEEIQKSAQNWCLI